MTNRDEYLAWAKERAEKYNKIGDWRSAWASFSKDLEEHSELQNHPGLKIGMSFLLIGAKNNSQEMRKYIEGFR